VSAVVLRERVIKPILSGTVTRRRGRPPKSQDPLDRYYRALRETMEQLIHELGQPPEHRQKDIDNLLFVFVF